MGAYRTVEIGIRWIDGIDVNFPFVILYYRYVLPGGPVVKNPPAKAGDMDSIPGWGRSPGGGNGNPLQYSCLHISMDREAWRATVQRIAKSWTSLRAIPKKSLY